MKLTVFLCACIIVFAACNKEVEPIPQEPPPPQAIEIDSINISINSSAILSDSFQIKYSGEWKITVTPNTDWLEVSALSGTGNKKIYIKATSLNTTQTKRKAQLTITPSDVNVQASVLEVVQEPYDFSSWGKEYGGSLEDNFITLVKCDDGGFLAAGTTLSNDGDVSMNHGEMDAWIVKIDVAGNIVGEDLWRFRQRWYH